MPEVIWHYVKLKDRDDGKANYGGGKEWLVTVK